MEKREERKKCAIKAHPSMNHMITFININPISIDAQLPVNTYKTDIDWNCQKGKEFQLMINECCGKRFTERYTASLEAKQVEITQTIINSFQKNSTRWFAQECFTDCAKSLKPDMLIYEIDTPKARVPFNEKKTIQNESVITKEVMKEYNVKKITDVVEIKRKGKVKPASLMQLVSYGMSVEELNGGNTPNLILIGGEKDKGLDLYFEKCKKIGYEITFISLNDFREQFGIDND